MTKWLASVQSLEEARSLSGLLPDILDMKNPSRGALGKLDSDTVKAIVDWVDHRCLTSATIGDLPMQHGLIAAGLEQMAATGVDYLKIGLFDDPQLAGCIEGLRPVLANLPQPVIAVLFADQAPKLSLVEPLKQSGFAGLMVDTAIKNGQGLRDLWSPSQLQQFVSAVKQQDMICGLAGALKIEDIEPLKQLGVDYLGFRSALCDQRQRTTLLQPKLAELVRQQLCSDYSLAV